MDGNGRFWTMPNQQPRKRTHWGFRISEPIVKVYSRILGWRVWGLHIPKQHNWFLRRERERPATDSEESSKSHAASGNKSRKGKHRQVFALTQGIDQKVLNQPQRSRETWFHFGKYRKKVIFKVTMAQNTTQVPGFFAKRITTIQLLGWGGASPPGRNAQMVPAWRLSKLRSRWWCLMVWCSMGTPSMLIHGYVLLDYYVVIVCTNRYSWECSICNIDLNK